MLNLNKNLIRHNTILSEYVVIPNHLHGILWFMKYIGDLNYDYSHNF